MKPIRTYEIRVRGFENEPCIISARSPAKARAKAFQMYGAYDDRCTFKQFLTMSRIRRVPNPPGVGQRIMVGGLPATRVYNYPQGQYVYYMRDDSDAVLCSHPNDVTTLAAE